MACPDICAITGVTETCISRNLILSVGTFTVWISAAEVLAALPGSPLYCAVSEWVHVRRGGRGISRGLLPWGQRACRPSHGLVGTGDAIPSRGRARRDRALAARAHGQHRLPPGHARPRNTMLGAIRHGYRRTNSALRPDRPRGRDA